MKFTFVFKLLKFLAGEGKKVRVFSMPCLEIFEEQDDAYKESVLPAGVKKRLAVEAGVSMSWYRYTTDEGDMLTIDHFWCFCSG